MKIIAHSYISNSKLALNGVVQFHLEEEGYLREAYQKLALEYPKFYKMDDLSKLAVLASNLLEKNGDFDHINGDDLELIFANGSASGQTDVKFIESYTNAGSPSPSLFVYTLANIVTGELCIKYKWYGENTFFITESFDASLYQERLQHAKSRAAKTVLCGWVESSAFLETLGAKPECLLFLVDLTSEDSLNLANELNEILVNYRTK